MAENNAQVLGETIREAAVKMSRIMELHDSIVAIVGDASEVTPDALSEIAPLYMELLSELRMTSTRLIGVAGALSGQDPLAEAQYQTSVIAENQLLGLISNLDFGFIIIEGDDEETE